MPRYHIWSHPDTKGVRRCLYDGCTVRVRKAYAEWRQAGAPWTSILAADIPKCSGLPPTNGR